MYITVANYHMLFELTTKLTLETESPHNTPCFSSSMFVSKYFSRSLVMDWSHWLCGREGTNRETARVKTLRPWQLLEGKPFLADVPIVYPHDIKVRTVGKKTGRSFTKRKLNWKPSWASWHPCLISAGCL